jgi:hypothetical protein
LLTIAGSALSGQSCSGESRQAGDSGADITPPDATETAPIDTAADSNADSAAVDTFSETYGVKTGESRDSNNAHDAHTIVDATARHDSGSGDTVVDDVPAPSICGNGLIEPGEDCELSNGPDACCDSTCQFTPAGQPCGAGILQPACDPDACDGNGVCEDKRPAADNTPCSIGGGDTCCSGECVVGDVTAGGCSDCVLPPLPELVISIVDSQSYKALHRMDVVWRDVATDMGHLATIHPASLLLDAAALDVADVLIVSSPFTEQSPEAVANVDAFINAGKGVYIQSEFTCTLPGNKVFKELVNTNGGSFDYTTSPSAHIYDQTQILGCLGVYPEPAPSLSYFWATCAVLGYAESVETIVWSDPYYSMGFSFCVNTSEQPGLVMTITDKDWINRHELNEYAKPLMRNIIARLAHASKCE